MTLRYALLDDIEGQARACIRLHGPDTRRFLQGTLTAEIAALMPDKAVPAALCTVKGKLVTEVLLLPGDELSQVLVLVPAALAASVAEHFDRHIIMDDVEVDPPQPVSVAVVWSHDDTVPAAVDGHGLRSAVTRHPVPGRILVGERAAVEAAVAKALVVDEGGYAVRRISTDSPAWGHELLPDFFPPEVGFVYAVSYDKGCFLGQEPLARIHARGQVNRVMVRVEANAAPPSLPAELSAEDRPQAGQWTTAGPDVTGTVGGLAIVRRSHAKVGAVLDAGGITVRVVSDPLGDDPGVTGKRGGAATVKLGRR